MIGKTLPVLNQPILSKKEQYAEEARIRSERAWAEKCTSTALEKERISRIDALLSTLSLKGKALADLGCGDSPFSLEESRVTAVDVARAALDRCPSHIKRIRGALPYVRLPEESFDGVLLTDVIAEIEPHLYRLLLSEISELMKKEAFCICSTELDFHSEDPLGHFLALLKTEFEITTLSKSYHRLYIGFRGALDAPSKFVRASFDQTYRRRQMDERGGFFRLWFYLNSLKWLSYLWRPLTPLKKALHNRPLLLFCEKISEILWGEGALSHVVAHCKRKSLHKQL